MTNIATDRTAVKVEIDCLILAKMLRSKAIAAADLRCLDGASKKQLWRLCLQACASHNDC